MITVSKGILHVMLACKWRYTLLTRPHMSKKWGGGPIDCECGGRIVEVRSTKQSVIKVLTPKSFYRKYFPDIFYKCLRHMCKRA